jgi:hypothetical protein
VPLVAPKALVLPARPPALVPVLLKRGVPKLGVADPVLLLVEEFLMPTDSGLT